MNPIDADLCPKCGNSLAKHSYFTQQAGVLFMCPPSLELPTEPTWGIAVHKGTRLGGEVDQWVMDALHLRRRDEYGVYRDNILDFIPLTAEQVARIEAAR